MIIYNRIWGGLQGMEAQLRGWRHSPGEGMKEWRRVRQEPWGNWGRGKGRGK